ncbi:hypothetical protein BJX68DRAFT_266164 [Aspergillus pseudodeflectus]|uniref:Uncharacterized protein n=1 Tax=Aspergillus pseudodeflectus TaxID=176178 RepID=A0ABR4KG55_9EURO
MIERQQKVRAHSSQREYKNDRPDEGGRNNGSDGGGSATGSYSRSAQITRQKESTKRSETIIEIPRWRAEYAICVEVQRLLGDDAIAPYTTSDPGSCNLPLGDGKSHADTEDWQNVNRRDQSAKDGSTVKGVDKAAGESDLYVPEEFDQILMF